ncbi:MAG: helix-turn-helix domain-containing protein [Methylobacterium sp.]|jgi:hypothetical protein|nr:helix-turn-helix domain-containing protein [Methylobacterium sp.]
MRYLSGCTECFSVWWACQCPLRCEGCGAGYRIGSSCGTPGCVAGQRRARADAFEPEPIRCEPVEAASPPPADPIVPECPPVQNGRPVAVERASSPPRPPRPEVQDHRPVAQRRAEVVALLGEGLSDREIARRAKVSPSTVSTVRREQSTAAPA